MSKIKFSYVIMVAVLLGIFAFGINADMVSANTGATGDAIGLPFDEGDAYDPTNPEAAEGEKKALGTIVNTMYTFATYLSGLIFGVSVIMIVWAGFKYATSQGETRTTETAKMQIITAGIGIGVALFAMVIVKVFAEIYGIS